MNRDNTEEVVDGNVEVLAPSALEAIERAHIDVQISTARRFPRSMELFKKRALSMVTLDEETAESCIYRRPVGKKKNDKGQWVPEFAEGASVRLAEIVAASYGNLRVSSRIVEQTPRYVKAEGLAHDLESNYAAKSEVLESTVKADGEPYSERMRIVVAKVALSKARRDATFMVVPKALCKTIIDAARSVALGDEATLAARREKVKGWVQSLRIDEHRVFAAIGVNGWSDVNLDHLETLTGVKTAMKDDGVTVDEAFPPVPKTPGSDVRKQDGAPQPPATPPTQQPTAAETPDPYAQLKGLMAESNITEPQMLAYLTGNKLVKPGTDKLVAVSDATIVKVINAWANVAKVIGN